MVERRLAFVLGGGGARGALQAGALRAFHEADYRPELFVGTSIGAINAVFLGLYGFTPAGLAALQQAWRDAETANLLPPAYFRLALRALLGREDPQPLHDIRDFLARHGVRPTLTFGDLRAAPIRVVATDLRSGDVVVYGDDPAVNVAQAVLASAAVPPWIRPVAMGDRLLLDGGVLTNLPIEPALDAGATEIIAFDLNDGRSPGRPNGLSATAFQVVHAAHRRQAALEVALAAARNVPVRTLHLCSPDEPVSIWDFPRAGKLMADGFALARAAIEDWETLPPR